MDKKLGIYLCSGCHIGECLDMQALEKAALGECKAAVCKKHEFLCGREGLELINNDIKSEGVNTVVIGACSPRVNFDLFRFGDQVILERVNLREHVAWCHKPNDEDTQMLAEDYLRMGAIKAVKINFPEPYIAEGLTSKILIIGGGVSGLTSAFSAASLGTEVVLVEKQAELGGWVKNMHRQYPKAPPHAALEPTGLPELIDQVKKNSKITVYTSSTIEKISGEPGRFEITIKKADGTAVEKAASIIVATGWKPYDAKKLEHLSFGKHPNIITNVMMEEMVSSGRGIKTADGQRPKRIAFIQCAGSRDPNHLPYCSSVCCNVSLKQAMYCREQDPDSLVFVFYKDLRTPGHHEDFYRHAQNDAGTFLTKCEITNIDVKGNTLVVNAADTLLGKEISVEADLVVLATGMVPTALDEKVLHLAYRKGDELPQLKYGFTDSHFICFPYETERTGIYASGCARAPLDTDAARSDGTGAAMKAIQCADLISRGMATLPRFGDNTYPEMYMQRCTDCKRCTEECPFGAYDETAKGTPLPNPARCRRCGICMGSCPERIISFKNYNIEILSSMIKNFSVPDEFEEKPRILAFMCENDAYPAMDMAGLRHIEYNPHVRIIPVRCIGSVNNVLIADALSGGVDGILLIGCKHGDDYQCHFIRGSELIGKREGNLQETLQRLALEPERIKAVQLSINEYDRLPKLFSEYVEEITEMGFNPFKGM
ncbi:MAG: hydrogenase iron-sulfur subunit [Deltaproteobacteria bacterium]|nr:hydrogenase iron-sulfur subunit [Deltaproteobacteria bacterium]